MRWLLLLLTACGTSYSGDGAATPDATTSAASTGEALYADACGRCHGAGGDGSTDAPQIRNPVRAYASYVVNNGRADQMGFGAAMPAIDIGDADLAAIYDYLDRAPRPTDGQGLYLRFCGNCHGGDAKGGRVGESIAGGDDDVSEKVRKGHSLTSYGQRTKYMPKWLVSELSDGEVSRIESYLGTLPGGEHDGGDDDDDD